MKTNFGDMVDTGRDDLAEHAMVERSVCSQTDGPEYRPPPIQPLSASLKQLSPDIARAHRWVFDSRVQQQCLEMAGADSENVRVKPCAPPSDVPVYRLAWTAQGHPVEMLWASDSASVQAMARTFVDSGLKAMVLQMMQGQLESTLRATGVDDWHLHALEELAEDCVLPPDWFMVQSEEAVLCRLCFLRVDHSLLQQLDYVSLPSLRNEALRATLSVKARLCVATKQLRLTTLKSLQAGDVLLIPQGAPDADATLIALQVRMARGQLLVAHARWVEEGRSLIMESELDMTQDDQYRDWDEEQTAIADIEMTVRIELQSINLPLAQLEALTPGYVIELGAPVDTTQLRLISNGTLIGFGEMVSVGGRLGVRINQMNVHNESESGTDR